MTASELRAKAENQLSEATAQRGEFKKRRDSLNYRHIETTNITLRDLLRNQVEAVGRRMRGQVIPLFESAGVGVFYVSATPTASRVFWNCDFSDNDAINLESTGRRFVRLDRFEAIIKGISELITNGILDQHLQIPAQKVIFESLPTGGTIWNEMLQLGKKTEPQYETRKMDAISLPPPPPALP